MLLSPLRGLANRCFWCSATQGLRPWATGSRPVGADGTTNALSLDVEHLGLAQGAVRGYYYNESWQVVEERKDGSDDAHTEYVWDVRHIDVPDTAQATAGPET